jgi:hypothetical protein
VVSAHEEFEAARDGHRGVAASRSVCWAVSCSGGFKSLRRSNEGRRIQRRGQCLVGWGTRPRRTLNGNEVGNDEYSQEDVPPVGFCLQRQPEGRVFAARWNPKGMRRIAGPQSRRAIFVVNRSAKGGAWSGPHHGGEGVLIRPPYQGVCGRHGREDQDVTPRGLVRFSGGTGNNDPISLAAKWKVMPGESSDGRST